MNILCFPYLGKGLEYVSATWTTLASCQAMLGGSPLASFSCEMSTIRVDWLCFVEWDGFRLISDSLED